MNLENVVKDPWSDDENIIFHPENRFIFQMKSRGLDKWWFYDESYWDHGPFASFKEASKAMLDYIEHML